MQSGRVPRNRRGAKAATRQSRNRTEDCHAPSLKARFSKGPQPSRGRQSSSAPGGLLELKLAVAQRLEQTEPVTPPGIPATFPNSQALISDDSIRPPAKSGSPNSGHK